MANKNKLSIYLIKNEFEADEDIIENYHNSQTIDDVGIVYLGISRANPPKWATSFLTERIDTSELFVSNARAVLLVRITVAGDEERTFAIVMGYGKSMLKNDVVEERFGLKVVLNTIKADSLRRINKRDIGGNQKLSDEQLPLKAGINDFGIDINRDLVGYIAGVSDDDEYASGVIAGGDILSLTAEVDITNISEFLKKTYNKYIIDTYKENFAWIDQIQDVKDSRIIEKLNNALISAMNEDGGNIWMAVPEVIDWSEINGFKYCGSDIYDDIFVYKVRDSFREGLSSFDQLKGKQIIAISALDDSERFRWTSAKCLFGELTLDGKAYCINNGKWYCVDVNFANQVNQDYASIEISTIEFDDYTDAHCGENSYSISFVESNSGDYILMDRENIPYGGGHSQIEVCDVLSVQQELIHIKPYSGSSTLSHLFNQAAVSTELLLYDEKFLQLANEKILEVAGNESFCIKNNRSIKIVIAIISKGGASLPNIPFFSKVSFRNLRNRLLAFGLEVSIKAIRNTKNAV